MDEDVGGHAGEGTAQQHVGTLGSVGAFALTFCGCHVDRLEVLETLEVGVKERWGRAKPGEDAQAFQVHRRTSPRGHGFKDARPLSDLGATLQSAPRAQELRVGHF